MYKIIGADEQEYGPISADQIRQWIAEGRANAQTKTCLEGTQDWKPLGMFPEFGFTTGPLVGNLPSAETAPLAMEEILAKDYSLDILSCLSRAWSLFKQEAGTVFLTFLLMVGLAIAGGFAIQLVSMIVGIRRLSFASQQYASLPFN